MPTKGKKIKTKRKSKSEPDSDECVVDPQSSKIVQRMASKTLSSLGSVKAKLGDKDDDVNNDKLQVRTSQSSVWLSKTKVRIVVSTFHSNGVVNGDLQLYNIYQQFAFPLSSQ